jgi:hypothetical protein
MSTAIKAGVKKKKLKLSHCMPQRHLGGEKVQLLLILDLSN